jgi:hypothetical protein
MVAAMVMTGKSHIFGGRYLIVVRQWLREQLYARSMERGRPVSTIGEASRLPNKSWMISTKDQLQSKVNSVSSIAKAKPSQATSSSPNLIISPPTDANEHLKSTSEMVLYKNDAIAGAQTIIGHTFTNSELCWEALQAKAAGGYTEGNKRLALVGDAVLRLLIIKSWYTTDDRTGK